jgi:hypothetical protein
MNMHFWRDAPILSGKSKTLIDFMEEYVSKMKIKSFRFPEDYEGSVFDHTVFVDNYSDITDENKYDVRVKELDNYLGKDYRLIVTFDGSDDSVFKHELSHVFFDLFKKYRIETRKMIKEIDPIILKRLKKILRKLGYTTGFTNELQAYLSTGVPMREHIQESYIPKQTLEDLENRFQEVYNKYSQTVEIKREHILSME